MKPRALQWITVRRSDYWDDCIACAAWGALIGLIVAFLAGAP